MAEDLGVGDLIGRIRRRLLVNQLVDPDEARRHLPDGVRPHLGSTGGVVVGCCMIEIEAARPWPMPALVGVSIRAAAHRISIEVGSEDDPTMAVWVPVRHTDSYPGVAVGGRLFPGVHVKSVVTVDEGSDTLGWSVKGRPHPSGAFDIEATAGLHGVTDNSCEVADIVIGTALGLSPGHRAGSIEAVEMKPAHYQAEIVDLEHLSSDFMSSFSSAVPAETLLMSNVDVTWHPVD